MQNIQTQALTWPLPTGIAASDEASRAARINHYLSTTETTLADGTRVIPTQSTLKLILKAWDTFGIELIISSDSYIVKD